MVAGKKRSNVWKGSSWSENGIRAIWYAANFWAVEHILVKNQIIEVFVHPV
jgi:hypothetical protein